MPLLHGLQTLVSVFPFNTQLPRSDFFRLFSTVIIFSLIFLYFPQFRPVNSLFPDDTGDFKNLTIKALLSSMIPQYFSKYTGLHL